MINSTNINRASLSEVQQEHSLDQLKRKYMPKFQSYIETLNEKIKVESQNNRIYLVDIGKKFQDKIENYFDSLVKQQNASTSQIDIERCNLLKQLQTHINQINKHLNEVTTEAIQLKAQIELEMRNAEYFFDSYNLDYNNNRQNYQNKNDIDEEFYDGNALILQEKDEDLDCDLRPLRAKSLLNKHCKELEKKYLEIDALTKKEISLDQINNNIKTGRFYNDVVESINKFLPQFLHESCLTSNEVIDHTMFQMETQLSQQFSFVKNEKCYITFMCNISQKLSNLFDHKELIIDLQDSDKMCLFFDLKEKITPEKRFIRVCFTPTKGGIYNLSIKYKNVPIPNSPFYFAVLENGLNKTSIKVKAETDNSKQPVLPNKPSAHWAVGERLEERLPKNELNAPAPTIPKVNGLGVGRGRLLQLMEGKKLNQKTENPNSCASSLLPLHGTSLSQKRKTPLPSESPMATNCNPIKFINSDDVHMELDDKDSSVSDLSRKLKRMVYVDESENQYHNYSTTSLNSLSLNVNTNQNIQEDIAFSCREVCHTANILSDHLRKHTKNTGLIRTINDIIPPVKAIFERKFTDCNFPIGVRCEKSRNWLIVCDSSSNSIKIFDNSNSNLIHHITAESPQYQNKFTLKRPSAVLINNDDGRSEIYVKDDKEIFVFDLNNNFEFLRKFGFQILKRPYGLAYDSNKNLVLVDADFRQPNIYIFNKYTGQIISSKPYEPILDGFAQSEMLIKRFTNINTKKDIISSNILPFQKTKIRFIYCNQDYLYASDLGRSIVYKTNLNGEIIMAFGHFGRRRGEFCEPSGIHVENDGSAILIGDSKNDRLQIYDSNGVYKCDIEFSDEKPIRPSDFHVDVDGFLYVSNFIQKCVKKYKLVSK